MMLSSAGLSTGAPAGGDPWAGSGRVAGLAAVPETPRVVASASARAAAEGKPFEASADHALASTASTADGTSGRSALTDGRTPRRIAADRLASVAPRKAGRPVRHSKATEASAKRSPRGDGRWSSSSGERYCRDCRGMRALTRPASTRACARPHSSTRTSRCGPMRVIVSGESRRWSTCGEAPWSTSSTPATTRTMRTQSAGSSGPAASRVMRSEVAPSGTVAVTTSRPTGSSMTSTSAGIAGSRSAWMRSSSRRTARSASLDATSVKRRTSKRSRPLPSRRAR